MDRGRGNSPKRGRGRGGRNKPSNNLNRTMESNGPDVKVRGTAHQICDKYQALARDAHASGDRIAYENYLQHAEHYHRIILLAQPPAQENAPAKDARDTKDADESAETANSEETVAAAPEEDGNGAEAPRRARRGRRTRPARGNGKANGSGDDGAGGDDAEAPVETA